jgi:hypothetical protein
MRSIKEESFFPFTARTICYIEVSKDGSVQQIPCNKSAIKEACLRVRAEQTTLYAVWPGQYRSDLFVVDNIDALSDAYGIERKKTTKE